jgi:hypothetical protein
MEKTAFVHNRAPRTASGASPSRQIRHDPAGQGLRQVYGAAHAPAACRDDVDFAGHRRLSPSVTEESPANSPGPDFAAGHGDPWRSCKGTRRIGGRAERLGINLDQTEGSADVSYSGAQASHNLLN